MGDLKAVLAALNGTRGRPDSFNNLHDILEAQHYRLAFWKSGSHEINYRRFFAVDTLVGVHVERQEVFDDTHRLLRDLLARGIATGVRIDHIDGLWDPARYLQRLAQLRAERPRPHLRAGGKNPRRAREASARTGCAWHERLRIRRQA